MNEHDLQPRTTSPTREGGFTLVEVGIVMLIVIILAAIVIPTFFGAKNNATQSEFVGVARSYVLAIEAFKLDHDGQAPVLGSADWPATAIADGPINTMPGLPAAKRRYLRSGVPASMKSGADSLSTQPTGKRRHIQYVVSPDGTSYSLVVVNGNTSCTLGTSQPGVKACA